MFLILNVKLVDAILNYCHAVEYANVHVLCLDTFLFLK